MKTLTFSEVLDALQAHKGDLVSIAISASLDAEANIVAVMEGTWGALELADTDVAGPERSAAFFRVLPRPFVGMTDTGPGICLEQGQFQSGFETEDGAVMVRLEGMDVVLSFARPATNGYHRGDD